MEAVDATLTPYSNWAVLLEDGTTIRNVLAGSRLEAVENVKVHPDYLDRKKKPAVSGLKKASIVAIIPHRRDGFGTESEN